MALRNLRFEGDPILNKVAHPVTEMKDRLQVLIDDMLETMYENSGVGLAAPQVGVLRRIVVIDVGEGPVIMVNPEITESDGEQTGQEGCLSVPDKAGIVTRPQHVKVKYQDRDMKTVEIEAEDFFARAICHELDHLDGHLYVEKVEGELFDVGGDSDLEDDLDDDFEE